MPSGIALEAQEFRRRERHVLRIKTDDGVRRRGHIVRGGLGKSLQQNGEHFLPVNHGSYLTISSPHMPAT